MTDTVVSMWHRAAQLLEHADAALPVANQVADLPFWADGR